MKLNIGNRFTYTNEDGTTEQVEVVPEDTRNPCIGCIGYPIGSSTCSKLPAVCGSSRIIFKETVNDMPTD